MSSFAYFAFFAVNFFGPECLVAAALRCVSVVNVFSQETQNSQ